MSAFSLTPNTFVRASKKEEESLDKALPVTEDFKSSGKAPFRASTIFSFTLSLPPFREALVRKSSRVVGLAVVILSFTSSQSSKDSLITSLVRE